MRDPPTLNPELLLQLREGAHNEGFLRPYALNLVLKPKPLAESDRFEHVLLLLLQRLVDFVLFQRCI